MLAMTRNNSSYWYGFEAIGTARQLMDGQGQVLDAYAFDAWGNELTRPQSPIPNPFRYVGKHGYYLDTESALMLLGVRYYSAANGLFSFPETWWKVIITFTLPIILSVG